MQPPKQRTRTRAHARRAFQLFAFCKNIASHTSVNPECAPTTCMIPLACDYWQVRILVRREPRSLLYKARAAVVALLRVMYGASLCGPGQFSGCGYESPRAADAEALRVWHFFGRVLSNSSRDFCSGCSLPANGYFRTLAIQSDFHCKFVWNFPFRLPSGMLKIILVARARTRRTVYHRATGFPVWSFSESLPALACTELPRGARAWVHILRPDVPLG